MTTSYAGASAHYLSPRRRDPVKRHWEEPVNHRILARALDFVEGGSGSGPVRVVDVGSGTGTGSRCCRVIGVSAAPLPVARQVASLTELVGRL